MSTSRQESLVLSVSCLSLGIGTRPRMTKLDLGGEHFGARPDAPRYDRFEESTGLDGIAEGILLYTANLEEGKLLVSIIFFRKIIYTYIRLQNTCTCTYEKGRLTTSTAYMYMYMYVVVLKHVPMKSEKDNCAL